MSVDGTALDVAPRSARDAAQEGGAAAPPKAGLGRRLAHVFVALIVAAIIAQSFYVVQARPGDLITGVHGMVDIHQPRHAAGLVGDRRHRCGRRWRPSTSRSSAPCSAC